jgi:hypothetical protein
MRGKRVAPYRNLICIVTLSTPGVKVDLVFSQPRGSSTLTSAGEPHGMLGGLGKLGKKSLNQRP